MSYSFSVTADTKVEAKEKIAAELERVASDQPVHATDRAAAQAAAESFVDLLSEPAEGQTIVVNVNGSLGWLTEGDFCSANIGIGARVGAKA
jgi:hypothetical protein